MDFRSRDMFIRDVRRLGRWFPERGCILEHQIFRFAKMILRDRCSTLYDLASLFRGRRITLDRWSGNIAKALARGRQLCIQLSIFEGSLAELLRFWCCLVNLPNWGSIAELLRFWRCQGQKWRKSRRTAALLMLSSSKMEEMSQNCCVFKLDRQTDRQTDNYNGNYNYTTLPLQMQMQFYYATVH